MNLIKKLSLLLVVCVLATNVLTGCRVINDRHETSKEAKSIAEDLIGEEVTYVDKREDKENKRVVYIFKDSRDNEFAIISTLRQQNLDGASFGPYYCYVSDSYGAGVFVHNKDKVMDILERYDLDKYLTNTRPFDEDIYNGDGVVAENISLEVAWGTYEENQDILKRVAAAGAELDALMSLNYNGEDMDKSYKNGFYFNCYGVGIGIRLTLEEQKQRADGTTFTNLEIAHFDCSSSSEDRWTEEMLYEHMASQVERVLEK